MDIQALIEAAKVEGGEQAFADKVQAELQAEVKKATAALAAEKTAAEASVVKLEAKATEFGDEMKPLQAFLRERGHGFKTEADLEALGSILDGTAKPSEDVMALARQLAGPMAEEGMEPLQKQVASLEEQLVLKSGEVETALAATDRTHARLLLKQAQAATDAPQLIDSFEEVFLDNHFMPYLHFEDVEANGKTKRIPAVRNGDVPIMTAEGQAGPVDLLRMAYDRTNVFDPSTSLPGDPNTRDFFASNGSGTGAHANTGTGSQTPVDAKRLGNTSTLADYRKAREKVAS